MLKDWKACGKKYAFVTGRFQPLHEGHEDLVRIALASGLEPHIFINESQDEKGRNPLTYAQRHEMIRRVFPELTASNLHPHKGNGVINTDYWVSAILASIASVADLNEAVLFYTRKPEDIGTYIYQGKRYENAHYVDFLGKPMGPLDLQEVTPDMVQRIYHANDIRKDFPSVLQKMSPSARHFYVTELAAANVNNRHVGASKDGDRPILDATRPPAGEDAHTYQARLLREKGKNNLVVVDHPSEPKR